VPKKLFSNLLIVFLANQKITLPSSTFSRLYSLENSIIINIIWYSHIQGSSQEFFQRGPYILHPLGPENPLKYIDFTSPRGLSPHSTLLPTPLATFQYDRRRRSNLRDITGRTL